VSICLTATAAAQIPLAITAKVIDERNQPVPFASIRLVANNSGVITNADGTFQIPARDIFLRDTLVVTCIGFKTKKLPVSTLDVSKQNIIRIQSAAVELAAIEIQAADARRLNGKRLVERAINRIPYNYSEKPFSYIAYYRDYQILDSQYVNMNEALVQINDSGFTTNDQLETRMLLIEYKANKSFAVDNFARMPYDNVEKKFIPHASLRNFAGNELSTLRVHDPIRNHKMFSFSFMNKLDKDFIMNHRFSISGRLVEDGTELFIVSFATTDRASGPQHQGVGKIYIEKENYRIHKIQYTTNEWREHKAVPLYTVNVEYALHDNLMYLNYISFNNEFKMRNADDFKVKDVRQMPDSGCFVVSFTHAVTASGLNPANYDFRLNGKRLAIRKISFGEAPRESPDYRKEVFVYPKYTLEFNAELKTSLNKNVTLDVTGVRDLRNREVGVYTFVAATQYREIFVQQIIVDHNNEEKYPVIDKFTPLYKMRAVNRPPSDNNFWMNTPLKKELEAAPND
jgi:hypothetical protein